MSELIKELCNRYRHLYAMYPFGNSVSVVKYPQVSKYFLEAGGCSCPGGKRYGDCKHQGMYRGVWTPMDGTPDWFHAELSDLLTTPELPESFSTAVVTQSVDFSYPVVFLTVKYLKFQMGIEIRNIETYRPDIFRPYEGAKDADRTD